MRWGVHRVTERGTRRSEYATDGQRRERRCCNLSFHGTSFKRWPRTPLVTVGDDHHEPMEPRLCLISSETLNTVCGRHVTE